MNFRPIKMLRQNEHCFILGFLRLRRAATDAPPPITWERNEGDDNISRKQVE
jgi:hypothetical protein